MGTETTVSGRGHVAGDRAVGQDLSWPAMATTSPATTEPTADVDWEVRATRKIVETVEMIRDQTAGRAIKAARIVLLVLFSVSLGTLAVIIGIIGAVRALDNYLPDSVFGETHTWAAHSLIGLVFVLLGLVLLATKARRHDT